MTPRIGSEQLTDLLKSALQTVRVAYLTVGKLLTLVRDEKRYAELGHADLKSYARDRLQLGSTSLGNYLRVHDWVAKNHPNWFNPEPGCFIPDLNDAIDLIGIQKDLARKGLDTGTRASLQKLQTKALAGELKKSDRVAFRSHAHRQADDGLKTFLSKMRALRAEGAKLEALPPEIVTGLDDLIALLQNSIKLPLRVLEGAASDRKAGIA
jgi:hypothetical protein